MSDEKTSKPNHTPWEEVEAELDKAIGGGMPPDSMFEDMKREVDSVLGPPKRHRR